MCLYKIIVLGYYGVNIFTRLGQSSGRMTSIDLLVRTLFDNLCVLIKIFHHLVAGQ